MSSPFAIAAPELIRLGFNPLPIIPASKVPGKFEGGQWRAMFEWQRYRDRQPTPFELSLWSRNYPDANIGVVLGSSAGHDADGVVTYVMAVDIDVEDHDAFQELLGQLPHSPMAKRGMKGRTLFYRATKDIKSKPYNRASDKKRLVDLLSGFDTRQTITAPSVHPDTGQPYVWLAGPVSAEDLPIFDSDDLTKLEEALSALGWDPNAPGPVAKSSHAPRSVAGDPDDLWSEVKRAAIANLDAWVPELGLHNCRRARGGYEAVATWRSSSTGRALEDRKRNLSIQPNGITDFGTQDGYSAIDLVMASLSVDQPAATAWLRERLGLAEAEIVYLPATQAPEPAPAATIAVSQPATSRIDLTELPEALTHIPGLLGELTDWIAMTSRRPQRGLALGAALTVLGTAAGRKYAGPTRSATHLYVLGLAPSGAGKDHPSAMINRILAAADMGSHIGPSQFMSMQAVVGVVMHSPLSLCAIDEFGSFVTRINRSKNMHEKAITGVLRQYWGTSFDTVSAPAWAQRQGEAIHSPALSIFGTSTPAEFFEGLQGGDIFNGFLNRFLIIGTAIKPPDRKPPLEKHDFPAALKHGLQLIYGSGSALVKATQHNNQADAPLIEAAWGAGAEDAWNWLHEETEKRGSDDEDVEPFFARTAEIAIRMATIRAIGRDHQAPVISLDDMTWASDLSLWASERMIVEARELMAQNEFQSNHNLVLRLIRTAPGGRLTRSQLTRKIKGRWDGMMTDRIIKALGEAGLISSPKPESNGGRPLAEYIYTGGK